MQKSNLEHNDPRTSC